MRVEAAVVKAGYLYSWLAPVRALNDNTKISLNDVLNLLGHGRMGHGEYSLENQRSK